MEVILIKDVDKLGYANDIVDVRPGYANNYLIPQGLAKSATASARKILAENLKQQAHKEAKLVGDADRSFRGGRRRVRQSFLNKDSAPFPVKRGAVFIHATAVTPVGDFPAETIRPKRPPFRQATLRGLPAEKTDSP